ncbi:unnamed protein product [Spirodela intermedia]|uniref:Uncharacterized protein n=1 Tax=Spirodela intermedia TaxID=51605 RepID=A0A7I8KPS1_SPIIN|nr:unnamed protein product [Spirodela intermedia]
MALPPPPASCGQYWSQFLSSALSARGPNALPYQEDAKWLIRHHLVSLAEAFPSLPPKSSLFTHNDGRSAQLLQAEGTIPIRYAGVVYNIPAAIWLLENYPRCPPSVFLLPTSDMVVKRNHTYVDQSGHVSVPYLCNWIFPSSNLVDLVRTLSHLFSQEPPLFTREKANPNPSPIPNSPRPPPPSSSTSSPSPSPSPSPSRIYSQAAPYGAAGGRLHQSPQRRPAEDPAEVYRRNAVNRILEVVHADMVALRKTREVETEELMSTQGVLRRREDELRRGLRDMQGEKEGLEQQLQVMLMNADVLEQWLRENEGKKKGHDVDAEELFEPCDPFSKQLIECTAVDLAAEDAIYSLDTAVREGAIPLDLYLKNIRVLSREQFFHRATSKRVRAAQVEAQVSGMAATAPQYSAT